MNKLNKKLAIFLATSGHSGVDKIMGNLICEIGKRNIPLHLLRIKNHGPFIKELPESVRVIDLGASHVNTALPALIRYLKKEKPAFMLTDKDRVNRAALLARMVAHPALKLSVRVGTTVSKNLEKRDWLARNLQILSIRTLYKKASNILVPSRGAAHDLKVNFHLPLEKIKVVPSPVIGEDFEKKCAEPVHHKWIIEKKAPVILGVGELCSRKDFATLINAFALVRKEMNVKLIIAGKGKKKEQLIRLAKQLGIDNDVDLIGFVSNPLAWMAKSDLFVLSSQCEGMPVVLIEALAAGTPVVSTDCPSGPRELLQNGAVAPLVPVGDIDGLAHAIKKSLMQKTDPHKLKQAVSQYNVSASTDSYLEAIGWHDHQE